MAGGGAAQGRWRDATAAGGARRRLATRGGGEREQGRIRQGREKRELGLRDPTVQVCCTDLKHWKWKDSNLAENV